MRRGFTLVEMLIVIALTAMLAGLGAVASFTFLRSQRLEATAETIVAEITRVRSDAFTQVNDTGHGVEVFTDRIVRFDGNSFATRNISKDAVTYFPSPVTLSGIYELDFAPGTLKPVNAGTIIVADDEQSYLITVSSYGVIDITKGSN